MPFFKHGHEVSELRDVMPHQRDRCIMKGMRRDVMQSDKLPAALPDLPKVDLDSILVSSIPNEPMSSMKTDKGRTNLLNYVEKVREDVRNGVAGRIAIVEIHRAFNKVYPPQVTYDTMPPLRACGQPLWLMSTEDIFEPEETRRLSRKLADMERLRLQGHPYDTAMAMPAQLAKFAAGNAWAVPALACTILPILKEVATSGIAQEDGTIKALTPAQLQELMSLVIDEDAKMLKNP